MTRHSRPRREGPLTAADIHHMKAVVAEVRGDDQTAAHHRAQRDQIEADQETRTDD